jgi:hypothetical protein
MIIPPGIVLEYPRFIGLLEKVHCMKRIGKDVTMNTGTMIAAGALILTLLSGMYGAVIVPMQEDIEALKVLDHEEFVDHEIRIRAGEMSDSRTGVHLETLTAAIDRLINKMENNN